MKSKSLKPILLSVGVITMSLAVNFALAWTEPAGAPPSGNVSAPVNVSSTGQTKAGALTVQGNFTAPIFYDGNDSNYYVNPAGQTILAGSVGIGTGITTPTNTLQVKDLINFPSSTYGTFLGYQAGNVNTETGYYNTFVGYQAGRANTTGQSNTAIGVSSFYSNVSGYENVANGYKALESNTGGYGNTAIGAYSLESNSTGWSNTSGGKSSLQGNTTGNYNTAFGHLSLRANTTGVSNVAYGYQSLYSNVTGIANTAIGTNSLYNNTGSYNTVVGVASLYQNISGTNNTAVGHSSLQENQTGSGNVALGDYAGRWETGSNSFYIDNQDRGSSVNDKARALMYGTFAALPANQKLTINANVAIGATTTAYKLDVQGGQINTSGGLCIAGDCKTAWSQVGGGGDYWTQTGTTLRPSTTSWQPLFGSTANSANYPYAAMISSKGVAGSATGALIGIAGEALSDGTKNVTGVLGIGKGSGAYSGRGMEGAGYVTNSADTAGAYGGYFYADSTHSGGINVGLRGYANYSSNENYGVQGVAITPSTGSTYITIGTYGAGTTYSSYSAAGIYGKGLVNATGDTAGAYGAIFYANSTHAGGPNYGVYSNASGGSSNYSFYGAAGTLYNAGSIQLTGNIVKTTDYLYLSGLNGNVFVQGSAVNQGIRFDGTGQFIQAYAPTTGLESNLSLNPNGGNVGVGIAVPTVRFQVRDPVGNLVTRFEGLTNAYTSKMYISSVSSGDGGMYYSPFNNNSMDIFSYGDMRFDVGTGNISGTIANQRMVIQQGGNVGIGTNTPGASYKLDVNGNVNVSGTLTVGGSAVGSFASKNGSATRNDIATTGAQTIAHGLGKVPKSVKIKVVFPFNSAGTFISNSDGVFDGTTQSCRFFYLSAGSYLGSVDSSYIIRIYSSAAAYAYASVTVDATNINLTWFKSGLPTEQLFSLGKWEDNIPLIYAYNILPKNS